MTFMAFPGTRRAGNPGQATPMPRRYHRLTRQYVVVVSSSKSSAQPFATITPWLHEHSEHEIPGPIGAVEFLLRSLSQRLIMITVYPPIDARVNASHSTYC